MIDFTGRRHQRFSAFEFRSRVWKRALEHQKMSTGEIEEGGKGVGMAILIWNQYPNQSSTDNNLTAPAAT